VSNKIVDDTSVLGTTVGAVLQKLKDNNTNLNLNAVAISTAGFVDPSATISRDTASSL
jgi:hypothetical protein